MATQDIRSTVPDPMVRRDFDIPLKWAVREIDWENITDSGDTYEVLALPAKSAVLFLFFVVTEAFTSGGSATITFGHNDGTEDDVDFYIDTTDGALANYAVRSVVGGNIPAFFSASNADYENDLGYDTAAKNITVTVGTADLTAGTGYLVVGYFTLQ